MSHVLAYIPFVNPVNFFQQWWYLLLAPLALGISIIYKALRMQVLAGYWRQVMIMSVQVVLAMIALALMLIALVVVVIPRFPAG